MMNQVQVLKSVTYENGKPKKAYYDMFIGGTMIESIPEAQVKELMTILQQAMDDKKEVNDGKE